MGIVEKNNSSSRLLTEIEFLNKNSDERNPVIIKEMLDYLHLKGFKTQRCTLLGDLNLLESFNMGITHKMRKYYYQKSAFSIEELMLISDAICYSNYIDLDNSKRLIDKIKTLLAGSSAEKLVVCHAKSKKLTRKTQNFHTLLKLWKTVKILCNLNKSEDFKKAVIFGSPLFDIKTPIPFQAQILTSYEKSIAKK